LDDRERCGWSENKIGMHVSIVKEWA